MIWETLLGAALEAGLGLLAEAGFGDEVRALKDRWTGQDERALRAAWEQAKDAVDDEDLRALLDHRPFQEMVVTGLLDPIAGFDLQAAVAEWEGRLPPSYLVSLRRFFNALERVLLADESWGPILESYQAMRFRQDVSKALAERDLDVSQHRVVSLVNAELRGSGAIAQGQDAIAAGAGGMAAGGNIERAVQIVIQQLTLHHASPRPAEDLRQHYLVELARDANRLPWTIVEQEYAHPQRGEALGLAEVYTALDTTELEHVAREQELRRFLAQVARDETRRIPAQDMVNQQNRLVILGDPGSGKSTFVNYLSYTLAQAALADEPARWLQRMTPWDHGLCLPLPVELRALAVYAGGEKKQGRQLLLGYLQHYLKEQGLNDFGPVLNKAIRNEDETLLVLLDGLDEVPANLSSRIVGAVQDFADHYRGHRYVLTCRPYAYVGQACQLQRFQQVTLSPFNEKQINHFIETWYRQLARRERLSFKKAETQAGQMQRAVQRGDLRGLAQRPLLLTVMTLLHTFRGQLPQDRTELYADAVDLLLRRWEGRSGEEEDILEQLEAPGLKMSDLEAGLYDVAYRAHSQASQSDDTDGAATADVDEGDLRKWLAPYLGGDWNKAGEFVDYIRERAGLLIRHKTDAYTFPHRTFQEFMAACHLLGMEDYAGQSSRLVRADLARWRQVFVLAAGYAARSHRLLQAISAVNMLCPQEVRRPHQPDAPAYRRAQLAGESLLEIGLIGVRREEAGQAMLRRVQDWLMAAMRAGGVLPARERAEAGDTLARLGDPRPGVGLRDDGLPDITWCSVPAGPFLMGSAGEDKTVYADEKPQHTYKIEQPYAISRYPISNAQYAAFVGAGGYLEPRYWTGAGWAWREAQSVTGPADHGEPFNLPNHPLVGVNWYEALAFCRWLTEALRQIGALAASQEISLPSEAQWEKAARGADGLIYPWGQKPDPDRANYTDSGVGATSALGCFAGGASPYGVEDMSGNVWEWCRTKWENDYNNYQGDNDLEGSTLRVVRGGAFDYSAYDVRCAFRYDRDPYLRYGDFGFRVVVKAVL